MNFKLDLAYTIEVVPHMY